MCLTDGSIPLVFSFDTYNLCKEIVKLIFRLPCNSDIVMFSLLSMTIYYRARVLETRNLFRRGC